MPVFEYRCQPCGHRFEKLQKKADPPPCPVCGSHEVKELVSSFAATSAAPPAGCAPVG